MPSARTPDPASVPSAPGSAPGSATESATGPAIGSATPQPSAPRTAPAAAALPPVPAASPAAFPAAAFGGLRLIEVPGAWPPYDCEVHGTACPAASEVSVPVRAPARTRAHREVPSRPVLLSRSARAARRRNSGPRGRVVQAVRPGGRGNPGRRPVAETTRSLDDRTSPGADQPAHPDPCPRSEAQDPAHRDVAAGGAGGGDDRRAQLRAAVPRAGPAPGAPARPPSRARAARPPGAMALHRNRGRLERPF